jgi:hypothetical protein
MLLNQKCTLLDNNLSAANVLTEPEPDQLMMYSSRSKVSAAKLRNAKSSSTMANFNTTQLGQNTLFFDDF